MCGCPRVTVRSTARSGLRRGGAAPDARNARFASLGNGLAAVVMGATGAWLSSRAVFVLTALLGWASLPLRGLLLAVLPGPWLLVAGQAISGISAAVFGVMLPLLAADLTRGTSHFNLCLGSLGLAMYLGAALSTTLGGWIADAVSLQLAFGALGTVGLLGTLAIWWAMPETRTA